jgi:hypothetical protein
MCVERKILPAAKGEAPSSKQRAVYYVYRLASMLNPTPSYWALNSDESKPVTPCHHLGSKAPDYPQTPSTYKAHKLSSWLTGTRQFLVAHLIYSHPASIERL